MTEVYITSQCMLQTLGVNVTYSAAMLVVARAPDTVVVMVPPDM